MRLQVLFFTEPIDEWTGTQLQEFEGKKMIDVTKEGLEVDDADKERIKTAEGELKVHFLTRLRTRCTVEATNARNNSQTHWHKQRGRGIIRPDLRNVFVYSSYNTSRLAVIMLMQLEMLMSSCFALVLSQASTSPAACRLPPKRTARLQRSVCGQPGLHVFCLKHAIESEPFEAVHRRSSTSSKRSSAARSPRSTSRHG